MNLLKWIVKNAHMIGSSLITLGVMSLFGLVFTGSTLTVRGQVARLFADHHPLTRWAVWIHSNFQVSVPERICKTTTGKRPFATVAFLWR